MSISPLKSQAPRTPFASESWLQTMAKLIRRGVFWIRTERMIRRNVGILNEFDDHMLADIGLRRCEIDHLVRYGRVPRRIDS